MALYLPSNTMSCSNEVPQEDANGAPPTNPTSCGVGEWAENTVDPPLLQREASCRCGSVPRVVKNEVDPSSRDSVAAALLAHLQVDPRWKSARYEQAPRRILGGNQSFVYGLELEGATELRGPLVLRILRPFLSQESVSREAAVQAALCELGYPVAAVRYACSDTSVLGGAFQLMERLAGAPMLAADAEGEGAMSLRQVLKDFRQFVFGPWPGVLAELHHRLHALSIDELRAGLKNRGVDPNTLSFECSLARAAARETELGIEGLDRAFAWLREHQAVLERRPLVLCHGDFFPNQVLAEGDRVTGVIDWTDACFGPAEVDVIEVKVGIETLPVPLGPVGRRLLHARARHFYDAYCGRAAPPDAEVIRYVEALRCTRSLMAVAERRRALGSNGDGANPNPYDAPGAVSELARRAESLTGARVRLPLASV